MSVPMRRALDPVERYNERLNRARSSNGTLALKLPAQASPAPRSARKERPVRTGLQRDASRSVAPAAMRNAPAKSSSATAASANARAAASRSARGRAIADAVTAGALTNAQPTPSTRR